MCAKDPGGIDKAANAPLALTVRRPGIGSVREACQVNKFEDALDFGGRKLANGITAHASALPACNSAFRRSTLPALESFAAGTLKMGNP